MLDILLSRVKEEIAIDGTAGSNINTVWEYVETISKDIAEQSNASVTPLIDDKYKSFLWNYLKIETGLEFYEDRSLPAVTNEGSKPEEGPSTSEIVENDASIEDILLMDNTEEQEEASPPPVIRKRKDPPVKKKPAPKKKAKPKPKPKPKRKRTVRKKVYVGGSDEDFEAGSDDESDSESDFEDDLSEESEESEASEELMTEDEDDQGFVSKKKKTSRSTTPKKTNPVYTTSLSNAAAKLNLQPISNIAELSYDQVNSQYGSRLYILGSPELQHEQLYAGIPPGTNLSINLIVILREIIRYRSKGLYQASITKLLDLDSRSTGHYVKSLEEKGAITRHGVSINKMFTNICVHARFKIQKENIDMNTVGEDEDANEIPYNVNADGKVYSQLMVRNTMIDLAKDAPNHAIMAQDVLHGMGFDSTRKNCRKWFNRVIDELCLKGIFKKSNAKVNTLGKFQRCLHLLRIPEDYNPDRTQMSDFTPEEIEFPITIKSTENSYPIVHILVDTSLESQCLQFMMAAGTYGVTQRDMGFALNLDEPRTIYKILERMIEVQGIGADRYGAVRHLEFEGRLRRFRYYTVAAYKKKTEDIDIVPEPLPESEVDESKLYESNYFLNSPHSMTEMNRHIRATKSAGCNRNTLSVMGLHPRRKGGPIGRPRKHPKPDKPPSDAPPPDTPRKRGRPKGDGTPHKVKKPKQDQTASASGANQTNTSTMGNQSTTPAVAAMDIDQSSASSSQAAPEPAVVIPKLPLLPCPAKVVTPPPTKAKKTQSLLNVTGAIVSRAKTPQTSSLRTAEVSTRITRSTKKVSFANSTETNKSAPEKASKATSKSAPAKVSKATTKASPSAITNQQGGRTLRKRTIADYFAKVGGTRAAVRVSEEPTPEPESAVASPNTERVTPSNETAASSKELEKAAETEPLVSTSNEPIPIDVDSQAGTASTPIELVENDELPTPSLPSSTTRDESEPTVVTESTKEPVPSVSSIAVPTELEPTVVIESTEELAYSSSSIAIPEPVAVIESAEEPATSLSSIATPDESEHMTVTEPVSEPTLSAVPEHISTEVTSAESTTIETIAADAETSEPATENTAPRPASGESTSAEPSTVETNAADMETAKQTSSNQANNLTLPMTMITKASNAGRRPFVTYGHKKNHLNTYLETRIKVLLAILEEYPILELGKELHDAYEQKAIEMNCSTKSIICGKTLWRTSQELAKRGLAQVDVVKIPMLNGKITERKMLLRNSVDMKGDQYKSYIRHMEDRKTVHAVNLHVKEVETMLAPVERLDERLHRMRQEVESLFDQGEQVKAHALQMSIEELSANLDKFGRESSDPKTTSFWLITALQYGWINARMIRVKLMHSYIFGLLDRGAPDTYPEERTVSVKGMINNMPLSVLCQTVGLSNPDEYTLAYVRDPNNGSTIFNDLPLKIKRGLFCAANKVIARVRAPLKVLVYLEVLSPVYTESGGLSSGAVQDKYSNKILSYKLNDKIPIKIRRKRGQPVLRVCEIKDTEDLAYYWSELQYACTNNELQKLSDYEVEPPPEDPVERDYFICVNSARNWSNNTIITRAQRRTLNSYVDKDKRTTPLENVATCRHIAEISEVPLIVVRKYYERVQAVMNRRSRVKEIKRLKRQIAPLKRRSPREAARVDPHQGRRIISLKSTRAFRPREYKTRIQGHSEAAPDTEVQRQKAIDEKHTKGELLYMDNMENLPVLPHDSINFLRIPRSKRTTWTVQEDELLIYVHIILRHRTRSKFFWAAASQVFPDRPPNSCRSRLPRLLSSPTFAERYETSAPLWDKYYREGLANGELEDPHPNENIYFDLLGYVSYFIRKMSENNISEQVIHLPSSVQTLQKTYDMSISDIASNHYFEDVFHHNKSMASKMQILYNQSFTKRKQNPAVYDQPWDMIEKERDLKFRQSNMCRTIILMTLMTPAEVYDPFYSYSILRKFPKDLQEEVTDRMLEERTLIRHPGARPIPGTRMSLSGKFFKTMVGKLPEHIFSQASEYERFLSEHDEKTRFSSLYISSGMMACLLNLISNENLSVSMANPRSVLTNAENIFVTSKSAKINLIKFDLDIRKTDNDREFMNYVPPPEEPHIIGMTHGQFEAHLAELLIVQDQFFNELLKKTIELLRAEEECGLTLYQLKSKLGDPYTDDDIKLALHKLCFNDPALVCRVGYAAVRYVLATFIDHWAVVTKDMEVIGMDPQDNEEDDLGVEGTQKVIPRKDTVLPNLWTDVNGSVTDLVLKGCKDIIVDVVLRKPGITEADVYRHLQGALCRRETQDLLNMLVEQRVLKQAQVAILSEPQKKASIFGKTKQVACTNANGIENLTQSCFWLTPTAHLNIS